MATVAKEAKTALSYTVTGKAGATATPVTLAGGTASVAPTTGTHIKGEVVLSDNGSIWYCSVGGTPGTWISAGGGASGLLNEQAIPNVPANGTTQMFANAITGRVAARDDHGADGFSDYRRIRGKEFQKWRSALAHREVYPANVYVVGDSFAEGYGASLPTKRWVDIFRESLQREYRNGGTGFVPVRQGAAQTWTNLWTNAGSPTLTDLGFGLGRRAINLESTDDISTITFTGDRFWILYTASPALGSMAVTIDGVQQTGITTITTGNIVLSGRVWDSGPLALGTHTISITPAGILNSVVIDGIFEFNTDYSLGVHFWDGSHSGFKAEAFSGGLTEGNGTESFWADVMFQPMSPFIATHCSVTVTGGTTLTFNTGTPTFTNDDIGEVVYAASTIVNTVPKGLRIVSVTNSTTIVVNKACTNGTYDMNFTRGRVTNAVTNATTTVTSATMAFNPWDVGKSISGTNIPSGTTIKQVVNTTTIITSLTATGSNAGTGTLQIKNRQKYPVRPDLVVLELGYNELFQGTIKSTYKTNLQAVYQTVLDVGQIDLPTMTGIYNDESPSVALLSVWAPANTFNFLMFASLTNGQPTISAATTGVTSAFRFTTSDVGKVVTGTGITGTPTIISVASDGNSATLSANATSSQTSTLLQLAGRVSQDSQWDEIRQAMYELSEANTWAFLDLYTLVGYIGNDTRNLTVDGVHANDTGQQWVADELAAAIGGVKKLASIPQGIFDNVGEMIVATGSDAAGKKPGVKRKLTADSASGAVAAVMVDITEWAFNIGPNETVSFILNLIWTTAAATSGILFDFNPAAGVSAPADLVMACLGSTGASAFTQIGRVDNVWGTDLTIAGGIGTAVPNLTQIVGSVTAGAVGGLITPRFAPEAAAATTLQRGSFALIL